MATGELAGEEVSAASSVVSAAGGVVVSDVGLGVVLDGTDEVLLGIPEVGELEREEVKLLELVDDGNSEVELGPSSLLDVVVVACKVVISVVVLFSVTVVEE